MDIPFTQWYTAIEKRRSRRQFVPRAMEPELQERMGVVCEKFTLNQPPFYTAHGEHGNFWTPQR